MSTPGWYPDPGGRSGHYRFWDGQTWAPTTTANPAGAAPGGAPAGPPPRRPRRLGRWLIASAVLVVALAVVVALVVRSGNRPIAAQVPSPSATGGLGTSSASSPSDAPSPTLSSPSPSGPGSSETPSAACPIGNPFARQDYPRDGRVHGGSLSFPRQQGWEDPGQQVSSFTWAYDVGETDTPVEPQWFSSYAVGAVSVADGFEDPKSAAELAMRCTVGSSLYQDVTSRTDLVDEKTTVDGYPAWTLRSEIRADDPRTSTEGDTVQITVVDLDSPEALAFFWGCAPIGDETLNERLDQVVDELEVG